MTITMHKKKLLKCLWVGFEPRMSASNIENLMSELTPKPHSHCCCWKLLYFYAYL